MAHFQAKAQEKNVAMPVWPDGEPIIGISNIGSAPFSISYEGRMYLFWIGKNPDNIFYSTTNDGINWSPQQPINNYDTAFYGVSACIFNGDLYLFWTTSNKKDNICYSKLTDGMWPNGKVINESIVTNNVVTCCEFNGRLYLIWRAKSNDIKFSASSDGRNWPDGVRINNVDTTSDSPDACVYDEQLYVFFKAQDKTDRLLYTKSAQGSNWPSASPVGSGVLTAGAISSCVIDDGLTLLIIWRDTSKSCNIKYGYLVGDESFRGPASLTNENTSTTDVAPSCCHFKPNGINVFWRYKDTQMYTSALKDDPA